MHTRGFDDRFNHLWEAIREIEAWDMGTPNLLEATNLLRFKAEQLDRVWVMRARKMGSSWTDIGRAVGVTRQGAQQKWADVDRTV